MRGLTKRQQLVLEFIQESIQENGFPPTLREIGAHFGIRSTNGVNDHLLALQRKGYLRRQDMKSRALRPTASAGSAPREVPLIGRVAAGQPLLAIENLEGTLRVDATLLPGDSGRFFALRVRGDSMIGAGILDGDIVFVRQQEEAASGTIVVAMVGDEATVKTLIREGERLRLQPANPAVTPIIVGRDDGRTLRILGAVVGVYRKLG
ncbi:MAG: transcriptional repressor LexA [Deltaproteobacteria bacterium]|nr:transcriptional repressor LexA [Deltaproteobacteria bacterium]